MNKKTSGGRAGAGKRIRAKVMREWRGVGEPLDLNARVSLAGEWVNGIMETLGVRGGLSEEKVKKAWKDLAGEAIARQTEPVSLRRGCLTLKVLQPAMRFHLEQLKGALLKRLQEELGKEQVKSLRLVIG